MSEDSVYISSVTLSVREALGRPVDHITMQTETGNFKKELPVQVSPGHEHKEVLDPVVELSTQDRLSVSVQYPSRWKGTHTLCTTTELSEVTTRAQDDGDGNQILSLKLHKNIEVTFGISLPPLGLAFPTVGSGILRVCPRFRVLVIGNSGAGRSSLIRTIFGVEDVDISDTRRGQAIIGNEFVAANKMPFVLHDSLGFEDGESSNLDEVKRFIEDRRTKENLVDRLHAVWVCAAVPYAKGQFLEDDTEAFLRNRKEILGDVVVVPTQLDLLDHLLIMNARTEDAQFTTIEGVQPYIEARRTKFLNDYCMEPLLQVAGSIIPCLAVSTMSGYGLESSLSRLVRITTAEIERYIKTDHLYTTGAESQSV